MSDDITLFTGEGYFNYRVGAIIMDSDKLLMVKNINYPYYYSVGSRVKFGETSENAVLKEVYEETNLYFEIERLAFIHENFFDGTITNGKFHEIALFYLMKPHSNINKIDCKSVGANGGEESLYWLPLDRLLDFKVYPEFFKTEVLNNSNDVRHLVTADDKIYRSL